MTGFSSTEIVDAAPALAHGEGGSGSIRESAGLAALLSARERWSLAIRLLLALIAAGLLVLSLGIAWLVPDQPDLAQLVAGGAALLVAVPVLFAASQALRRPSLHGITDQLVAVAVLAAWAVGDLTTAALLPLVMVIGHVLEERSLIGSREAIAALGRLTRTRSRLLEPGGTIREVDSDRLTPGDRVELLAGDRVPADGIVIEGAASLDTASITGESVPIEIAAGDAVLAGTTNLTGRLVVEIVRTGGDTALGKIVALMQVAEQAKPPVTRLIERYGGRYLVLVLAIAAGSWFATHEVAVMMAVIVASCPCALVLAAPATSIASIAVAGRHGILIKSAAFLEDLARVDAVILDKTGTVTRGELRLVMVRPEPGVAAPTLLAIAAGLGAGSNHPVSRAVAAALPSEERAAVAEQSEAGGLGVVGRLDGADVALGRAEFLRAAGIEPGPLPNHDGPAAGVGWDGQFLGWLLFADEVREEARAALDDLRTLGLERQVLLTGDRPSVAAAIAATLGMSEVQAEALPEQKLARVLAEIGSGYHPLVVGDGVNDSLALKAGAVGIAMGVRGTDVALASADVVLMTTDLRRLGTCIRLSRRCRRTVIESVVLGLAWTFAVVVAAAFGWLGAAGALVAALLHNAGSLAVIANAGRLLRFSEPG